MFAAFQRRWGWVFGGGLLGLALAVVSAVPKSHSDPLIQASLTVDVAQGPCYSRRRQLNIIPLGSAVAGSSCYGEYDSVRQGLVRLVKSRPMFVSAQLGNSSKDVVYSINRLAFDGEKKIKSKTLITLSVTGPSNMAPKISAAFKQIQRDMTLQMANNAEANGFKPSFGADWISIEESSEVVKQSGRSKSLALGLLAGLVVGAGPGDQSARSGRREGVL